MPPEVEAADLTDAYDAVFDQSLALQSTLQARGFTAESGYATLLGHKQRWNLLLTALEAAAVRQLSSSLTALISTILDDTHPLFLTA